jgi:hypothetical protein
MIGEKSSVPIAVIPPQVRRRHWARISLVRHSKPHQRGQRLDLRCRFGSSAPVCETTSTVPQRPQQHQSKDGCRPLRPSFTATSGWLNRQCFLVPVQSCCKPGPTSFWWAPIIRSWYGSPISRTQPPPDRSSGWSAPTPLFISPRFNRPLECC